MVSIIVLVFFITVINAHGAFAVEQKSSKLAEEEQIVVSAPMQSVILPCKAISFNAEIERVMWYKLTNGGQSPINVANRLITKDSRFSVAYFSVDHGLSPPKWDLHITSVRLSDAARYQCHAVARDNRKSSRSSVKLVVEDVVVDIQPSDVLISIGDPTEFSCNFTGEHRVRREKVTWLKDGKPLERDRIRVITSTELPNATVTTLQIVSSHLNDSGSYRCSDGHGAQSKEAKLYLRDASSKVFLRPLSPSTSNSSILSLRTVYYLLIFHFIRFIL